ncbi:MAG: hypothetical protein ASARMPRED_007046 [Alectoria sarmentosa]|nr:MAG: hypothetical protein ASARMPRED_007046 [Alectoria sarmentosa]
MVVLTHTLAPAPEAIKDSYEYIVSQPIRKEANRVGCSLPSPFESFAQEAINKEYIPNLAVNLQYVARLPWLTHFNIFQLVQLVGTISYDTLARRARVSVKQPKPVMRTAMASNLFSEPESGEVSHTATPALVVTNPGIHDWAVFMTGTTTPFKRSLDNGRHRAYQSKNYRKDQDYKSDPECPPLDYVSTVIPPLLDGRGLRAIEDFPERQQVVTPVIIYSNVARCMCQHPEIRI